MLTCPRPRIKGFTLTELMITVVLLGVVLVMGIPSFKTWLQNQQIKAMAASVLNGLQLSRAEAVKNNSTVTFALANDYSWTITAECHAPSGCTTTSGTTAQGNTYTVQSRTAGEGGKNAVVTPSNVSVTFNGVGRAASGAGDFDITNPAGGTCESAGGQMRCLRIQVRVGGEVRMCNPTLSSATDPRGC